MEQPIKRIDWWDSKIEIGEFIERIQNLTLLKD